MLTSERHEFASSSGPDVKYQTVVQVDGKVLCDCRGWTIKKDGRPRQCKHTREVIGGRPRRDDGEFVYLEREGA
jgi:hypothetical protein